MNNELLKASMICKIKIIFKIELLMVEKRIIDMFLKTYSIDIEEADFLGWILVTDLAFEFAWFSIYSNEDTEFCYIG